MNALGQCNWLASAGKHCRPPKPHQPKCAVNNVSIGIRPGRKRSHRDIHSYQYFHKGHDSILVMEWQPAEAPFKAGNSCRLDMNVASRVQNATPRCRVSIATKPCTLRSIQMPFALVSDNQQTPVRRTDLLNVANGLSSPRHFTSHRPRLSEAELYPETGYRPQVYGCTAGHRKSTTNSALKTLSKSPPVFIGNCNSTKYKN